MQNLLRFRHLVLSLPFFLALPLVLATAGCGSSETKVETTGGPTAEQQKAEASYDDMMKGKKPGAVIK